MTAIVMIVWYFFWVKNSVLIDNSQNMRSIIQQVNQSTLDSKLPNMRLDDFGLTPHASNAKKDAWTIINVWATWCTPCLNEIPELDDFNLTQTVIPVNLIGVTYETMTQAELGAFFKQHFDSLPSYPIEIIKNLPTIELQKLLNQGLPQTYIFNQEGVLLSRHVGELTSAMMTFEMNELLEASHHLSIQK